jgi:hypothetical protein
MVILQVIKEQVDVKVFTCVLFVCRWPDP